MPVVSLLKEIPQVAVMLPPAIKVCRDMRHGVLRYARTHGPWALHLIEDRNDPDRQLSTSAYSGIIAQPKSLDEMRFVGRIQGPKVLVDPQLSSGIPSAYRRLLSQSSLIRCDTRGVGEYGANYLLKQGYRHFAYVGVHRRDLWSEERYQGFSEIIAQHGYGCPIFRSKRNVSLISELKSLQEWLGGLEKPCAIMCAWDYRARQVIDAAQTLGLHVPGDVFVLGVDDDEAICLSSDPPIPSVRMNADTAGYEAARLLDQMMHGERAADRVTYGPVDVSENFTGVQLPLSSDEVVRKALELIRINVSRSLGAASVAKTMGMSLRTLERRFDAALGRSVKSCIELERIERVKRFLIETDEPVKAIAFSSGYLRVSHLANRFRQIEKMSMTEYRNRHRRI